MTGSAATGTGTYAISSLSAFVKVSREEPVAMVICSRDASTFGVGVGGPALTATDALRPIKQKNASPAVLITSNPTWPTMRIDSKRRTESGA
jgi:hypothetical protein